MVVGECWARIASLQQSNTSRLCVGLDVDPSKFPEKLAGLVKELAKPGDTVICLGAGSITQWAYALPGELQAL